MRGSGWGGEVVESGSPRPPRRRHREGTPVLMSSEASGRSRQRDGAAGGEEGYTPHRDGSDGISFARGDRRQVSSSAGGLSDRSVGDMTYGLGLGGCALRLPPREERPLTRKTLGFDGGSWRYGDRSADCCGMVMGVGSAMSEEE